MLMLLRCFCCCWQCCCRLDDVVANASVVAVTIVSANVPVVDVGEEAADIAAIAGFVGVAFDSIAPCCC